MATTNFVDKVTVIPTAWLNDVDAVVYEGLVPSWGSTPSSASDTGVAGSIAWDASYIYVCSATNTWLRVAIATW